MSAALSTNRPAPWLVFAWRAVRALVLVVLGLWSALAIYYSTLPWAWLRTSGALLFAIGAIGVFAFVRSWLRARLVFLGMFAIVAVWFWFTPPSNDRDWTPDLAVLPYADIQGDRVTVHNIRNCDYRSEFDYTVRHYDKTFDLAKLRSVDFFLVTWGSPNIAHTMVSFVFEGGDTVCFSIETRKENGESYSAVKGFFRQFELTYVVADERDLIRLRTNFRNEQVYLYRLKGTVEAARAFLLSYLEEVNRLKARAEWYNVVTSNCTTNIRGHVAPGHRNTWDWRMLINGRMDELLYERGAFDSSLPFAELKQRSHINAVAKAAGNGSDFSAKIRKGLPGF
jgi:hypothetical protein